MVGGMRGAGAKTAGFWGPTLGKAQSVRRMLRPRKSGPILNPYWQPKHQPRAARSRDFTLPDTSSADADFEPQGHPGAY